MDQRKKEGDKIVPVDEAKIRGEREKGATERDPSSPP
jgi:hypothetical protein